MLICNKLHPNFIKFPIYFANEFVCAICESSSWRQRNYHWVQESSSLTASSSSFFSRCSSVHKMMYCWVVLTGPKIAHDHDCTLNLQRETADHKITPSQVSGPKVWNPKSDRWQSNCTLPMYTEIDLSLIIPVFLKPHYSFLGTKIVRTTS